MTKPTSSGYLVIGDLVVAELQIRWEGRDLERPASLEKEGSALGPMQYPQN